ncbi:hypothetical protein RDABS01_002078 [Bienertia sinuspersici]
MSSDQFYSNANEHNSRMDMNDTKPKNSKQIIERVNKIGNDEGQLSETTTIKGVEGEEEIEWIEEGEDEEDARVELGLVNYNVEINNIDKNLFIFQFYQWKDKQRVLEGHPWHFNRYALILGEMEGKEKPSDISLCHLLMWVRVYNLPFKGRMNMVNVESIGKKIGTFVKMDNSGSVGIDKSIRIWVLIDARKPLMQKVEIKMRGGVEEAFDVKYEKPPLFCFVRGMLGHGIKDCEYWREEEDLPLKYGTWLKVSLWKRNTLRDNNIVEQGEKGCAKTLFVTKPKKKNEEGQRHHPDADISKIRANEIGETEGKGNQITIDTEATCEIKAGVNYHKQGDGGKGKTWKRVQRQETQVKIIEGNIVGHKRTDRGVEADICEQMEIDNPVRTKKQIVDAIYPTRIAVVDDVAGPQNGPSGKNETHYSLGLQRAKISRSGGINGKLRFNNFLTMRCGGEGRKRSRGLALVWKEGVDIWVQSYSLNHIDISVFDQRVGERRSGENDLQEILDRFLANKVWKGLFAGSYVTHLLKQSSDHLPILLSMKSHAQIRKERRRKKLFRFEEMWVREGSVGDIVSEANRLRTWSKNTFGNFAKEMRECQSKMAKLREEEQMDDVIEQMRAVDSRMDELERREELY